MNLLLIRFAYTPKVTLGYLYLDGLRLATLEEPWTMDPDGPGGQRREPGHYESCVPDGVYNLLPHDGAKYLNVHCLSNHALGVYEAGAKPAGQSWGREAILIHSGNTTEDIEGCILVGLAHDGLERIKAGTSRVALDRLRVALGRAVHRLEIRPLNGTQESL
jgi:hypothetical protein